MSRYLQNPYHVPPSKEKFFVHVHSDPWAGLVLITIEILTGSRQSHIILYTQCTQMYPNQNVWLIGGLAVIVMRHVFTFDLLTLTE